VKHIFIAYSRFDSGKQALDAIDEAIVLVYILSRKKG